jgi:hypothetical protein
VSARGRRGRAGRSAGSVAAGAAALVLSMSSCASAPPIESNEVAEAAAPLPPLPKDGDIAAAEDDRTATATDRRGETVAGGTAGAAAEPRGSVEPTAPAGASSPAPRQSAAAVPLLIVVDEGSSAVRPEPGELAQRTRREAAAAPGTSPRITNDNLGEYARRGRVTIAGVPDAASGAAAGEGTVAPGAADPAAAAAEPARDEAWWRARARGLREEWRATVDEIVELEEAAADLRWRFYAADDPWVRDGEVKPEWDRVLDRLSEARRRLLTYPERLDTLVEEGRREGALPGWLREGVELEPRPDELPGAAADPAEPVEPRQVDDGRGDGR